MKLEIFSDEGYTAENTQHWQSKFASVRAPAWHVITTYPCISALPEVAFMDVPTLASDLCVLCVQAAEVRNENGQLTGYEIFVLPQVQCVASSHSPLRSCMIKESEQSKTLFLLSDVGQATG